MLKAFPCVLAVTLFIAGLPLLVSCQAPTPEAAVQLSQTYRGLVEIVYNHRADFTADEWRDVVAAVREGDRVLDLYTTAVVNDLPEAEIRHRVVLEALATIQRILYEKGHLHVERSTDPGNVVTPHSRGN